MFRVLELPGPVATRYCGRLFVQLGAEVVRVADTDAGADEAIGFGAAAGRAFGRWLDAGKVTGSPAGPFDLVIAWADAAPPEPSPDAVCVVVRWFDPAGPYTAWPGTDEVILALAGLAHTFGDRAGPPTLAQGHTPQMLAGANAFNAALAALLEQPERRPSLVEVDVFESTMCLSEMGAVAAIADARATSTRLGVNRFSPTYPCTSYRAADGWVGVTCLTPAQWSALCHLIGESQLAGEHHYSTAFRRLLRADEIDAALAPAIERRTVAEWVEAGIVHKIPITSMPRPAALPTLEHWRQRAAFEPLPPGDDGAGSVLAPSRPFQIDFDGRPQPRWQPAENAGPLSGVRIVDFTMGWSGPQATRYLADLGADVVKVESPAHPDWYRGWENPVDADPPLTETRASFNTLNRNKRGVALDLSTAEGLDAAQTLIAGADVVIDNFAAGVLDRLGLGHAVQHELRPGVISVSMPAFGSTGPLAAVRAYGSTVEQASGLPFVNGEASWEPCLQHVAFGDPVAGVYAVTAVLVALANRSTQGGARIDLSQVEALFQVGADAIIADQIVGPLPRIGSSRARSAICAVLPARGEDRWVAVVTGPTSPISEGELARMVASDEPAAAAAGLHAAGVAAAPVQPTHELGHDPQLVASGFWQTMDRRYVGLHTLGAPPFRFDGRRPDTRGPAPTLGEHTEEVLAGARVK